MSRQGWYWSKLKHYPLLKEEPTREGGSGLEQRTILSEDAWVIGLGILKQKYTILQGIIPISLVSGSDGTYSIGKIVKICCGSVNLCPSVFPQD